VGGHNINFAEIKDGGIGWYNAKAAGPLSDESFGTRPIQMLIAFNDKVGRNRSGLKRIVQLILKEFKFKGNDLTTSIIPFFISEKMNPTP
jgi:hypothetical protein